MAMMSNEERGARSRASSLRQANSRLRGPAPRRGAPPRISGKEDPLAKGVRTRVDPGVDQEETEIRHPAAYRLG